MSFLNQDDWSSIEEGVDSDQDPHQFDESRLLQFMKDDEDSEDAAPKESIIDIAEPIRGCIPRCLQFFELLLAADLIWTVPHSDFTD